VVVPALADLIVVKGTKEAPVHNVTIRGLQFRDNRPTYMEPRTNPSGGDWALVQRFDFDCNLVVSRKVIIRTRAPLRIKPLYRY
jgi:hypothetical protein